MEQEFKSFTQQNYHPEIKVLLSQFRVMKRRISTSSSQFTHRPEAKEKQDEQLTEQKQSSH